MIKSAAIGLWFFLVAFSAMMTGIRMNSVDPEKTGNAAKDLQNIRPVSAGQISVPVMIDGKVTGYVLAKLDYVVNAGIAGQLSVPLAFFVNDEIFRVFFTSYSDTREIEKIKFDDVRQKIIDGINARLSAPVITDLLVEQFSFVRADQVRDANCG